jgi:cytochrome o ubiquinol oxidase operon protein cyoD
MNTHTYFEEIGAWPHKAGEADHAAWPAYVSGFALSLLFTLAAYALAVRHLFSLPMHTVIVSLAVLAAVQFLVQLAFFFHLGRGKESRERVVILACTTVVVGILLSGSIWIMFSLNQRMMPDAAQMQQYMGMQAGL